MQQLTFQYIFSVFFPQLQTKQNKSDFITIKQEKQYCKSRAYDGDDKASYTYHYKKEDFHYVDKICQRPLRDFTLLE